MFNISWIAAWSRPREARPKTTSACIQLSVPLYSALLLLLLYVYVGYVFNGLGNDVEDIGVLFLKCVFYVLFVMIVSERYLTCLNLLLEKVALG